VIVPFCLLFIYFLQWVYLRTSRQIRTLDLEAKSLLYTQFTETIEGLISIRSFGWQKHNETLNNHNLDYSQRPYYLMNAIQRWLQLVIDMFVAALATLLVFVVIESRSGTSAAAVGLALVNVLNFSDSISMLVMAWTRLETSLCAVSRTRSFELETERETVKSESRILPASWPVKSTIELKAVSCSYG